MKISVISGGFDPIHSGHISYINAASSFGDKLVVLLNSDRWLRNKKDKEFMPFNERKIVLEALTKVNEVFSFEDDTTGSCVNGLEMLKKLYPSDEIIFCNGGDRNEKNIPEMQVQNIKFKFGVGGDNKQNSSSSILKNWSYYSEERVWGTFFNLYTDKGIKVKELIVKPKSGMSFQKHYHRNEIWLVSQGECIVNFAEDDPNQKERIKLKKFDHFLIKIGAWHQIINESSEACKIIEIQYGAETSEDDIERLYLYNS